MKNFIQIFIILTFPITLFSQSDTLKIKGNDSKSSKELSKENEALKSEISDLKKLLISYWDYSTIQDPSLYQLKNEKRKNENIYNTNLTKNTPVKEKEKIKNQNNEKLKNIKDNLINTYYPKDNRLQNIDITTLRSDLQLAEILFPTNTDLSETIKNLIVIIEAKSLLNEKYNETSIKNAISKLSNIKGLNFADTLITDLKNYSEYRNTVIRMIDELDQINLKKVYGTSTEKIKEKRIKNFNALNVQFNRYKYKYLDEVITKITLTKRNDIDAEVKSFKALL